MSSILQFILLPAEISAFERRYLERVNRVALIFFAFHLPVFALIATLNHTGTLAALLLTAAVVSGPVIAKVTIENPRTVSIVHGVTAMFMGGLLVHFGQGPMQIEMHFYFFALIAMCAVFGNPLVIVAAAVTVALHHLVVWLVLPQSVFNYDASIWVVAVHAGFVVLESVAACFISRSFFDNVIGLEKIVEARTTALDAKNRDMRLLLDNIEQGFLTVELDGSLAPERSAAIDTWFGAPAEHASWFDYLARVSPDFSERSAFAWDEVRSAIMPVEVTLDQMPYRLGVGAKIFNVEYRAIGAEPFERFLVIVSDVTSQVEKENAESKRKEAMALFEHVLADRTGFETFFEEGRTIVEAISKLDNASDMVRVKRLIHTLKGNAAIFGLTSVARICHGLEDFIAEAGALPSVAMRGALADRWAQLTSNVESLLGKDARRIQIDEREYDSLLSAVQAGEAKDVLVTRVQSLKWEAAQTRLAHFGEQAQRIAERLEKGQIHVRVEGGDVRLDPKRWGEFWSAFIHAVRNALDHGIEDARTRADRGKESGGQLELRAVEDEHGVTIEIADDGNGIDWDAVRTRAKRAGLPSATQTDLYKSLFVDGFTTSENVTDLSGRGVGMGALLHATRTLGGTLTIDSTFGKGTRLRMIFPKHDDAVSRAPSAAA
jgi:two-component system, chemotaxis family, sensor kinase CheA